VQGAKGGQRIFAAGRAIVRPLSDLQFHVLPAPSNPADAGALPAARGRIRQGFAR
jgi:hypothetical protein